MTQPTTYRVHRCPAHGCQTLVPYRHFACPRDWARLPQAHKDAIVDGYRSGPLSQPHVDAMVEAKRWYRDNPQPQRRRAPRNV
jgi:hypothetical protein